MSSSADYGYFGRMVCLVKGWFIEGADGGELVIQVYGVPPDKYTVAVKTYSGGGGPIPEISCYNMTFFTSGLTVHLYPHVNWGSLQPGFNVDCSIRPLNLYFVIVPLGWSGEGQP